MHRLKRRKNLLKRVKGFEGGRKKLVKLAKPADLHAGMHAYRDRRNKKRAARQLFTIRINAAVRDAGISYSKLMGALKKKGVALDRKVLSTLAAEQPAIFEKVVALVK